MPREGDRAEESVIAVQPHTVSPPAGADRGRQNGIAAMIRPRLPVIPSAGRNLKSVSARPGSQCRAYIVTKSENNVGTLYVGLTLLQTL